jgi:hypothetical protein
MAHEVRARINTSVVAHKDLEIVVKTSKVGKLGTLLISKGNVEWLPKGNRVNRRRLTWQQLADVMMDRGKPVKKRSGR